MIRTVIKADLDVSDLVSHAGQAKGALNSISEAMERAKAAGDNDTYAKLAYEKERTQTRAAGFDRDVRMFANNPKMQGVGASGQAVFKMDQEYATLIRTQIDAIRRLTASYNAAIDSGDPDSAMSLSTQLAKQYDDFHKFTEEANGVKTKDKEGDAVKSIFANQIVSAINSGLQLWVSSRDRTGIINALGSGDIMGAQYAERSRRANMWSGGLEIAGAVSQGVGMAFGPVGIAVGTGLNLLTKIASSLIQGGSKTEGNRVAYAGLWEGQKDQAMNLAASLGDPTQVRESWRSAAEVSGKYGFSAEEGMEMLRQAASQGLDKGSVDRVFDYERRTGADRGAMSSLAFMSERYGGGDALKSAWRGLNTSGMQTGQYNEILRGLQRVMEDGISKGFVRSSDQVARNLTMLSQMTDYSPLWSGEMGAQRLSKMNSGLESTVGLQSSSDIIAFRAAQRVLGDDASYVDVLSLVERGLSDTKHGTQFMNEIMNIANESEQGDREGIVEILRDIFKFNYNEATTFQKSWKGVNDTELNTKMAKARGLPEAKPGTKPGEIPELKANIESMNIRNMTIEAGQGFWDSEIWKAFTEAKREYQEATNTLVPGADNTDVPTPAPVVPFNIRERIPQIDSMVTTVLPGYFGHGGDRRGDRETQRKMENILDTASRSNDESQIHAAFDVLTTLNNIKAIKGKWDDEDKLNSIANSGDAVQLLAALNRLIEIEERNGEIFRDTTIEFEY
jgi:hypothetical protein